MTQKQKLELTWIGKEHRPKLEPRILLEDREKSYHAPHRVTDHDLFDNYLICGDNLLALKALEQEFTGKVKCVFIDPPYNTGSAFEHYDDGVEHSIWLSLMRERLELLRRLLSDDGSLWITIDDNEAHYLKVLGDEIFGRRNFVANVIWEKSDSPRMDAQFFSTRHDHLLVFCKDSDSVRIGRIGQDDEPASHYDRVEDDGRRYYLKPLRAMGELDPVWWTLSEGRIRCPEWDHTREAGDRGGSSRTSSWPARSGSCWMRANRWAPSRATWI